MWVDSHCHIDFPDFQKMAGGVAGVIDRAHLNRVGHMLNISTVTQRLPESLALTDDYDNVFSSVGVHPNHVTDAGEEHVTAQTLIELAHHPKIIAIGESGLDYHYDYAPREMQHRLFREHIKAAAATRLPLIIHARDADDDIIKILQEMREDVDVKNNLNGVMHCFSSTLQLAEFALEIGFMISFSGVLTFKKAENLQDIAKKIPLDRLLVETDAPYLAPMPYRGKTNEPAYVTHTGRFLAELHKMDEAEMAQVTTDNFFRVFSKAKQVTV